MTLVLSNDDAAKVLTIADTIAFLEQLYADLAAAVPCIAGEQISFASTVHIRPDR